MFYTSIMSQKSQYFPLECKVALDGNIQVKCTNLKIVSTVPIDIYLVTQSTTESV